MGVGRPGGNPDLKPYFNKENAAEMARKATAARVRNNAARKALKESLNILLTKSLKKGDVISAEDVQNLAQAEDININAQDAMAVSLIKRAIMGDVAAATFIRDTVGEKPSDKVEVDQSVTIESWAKNHKVKL